MSEDSIFADIEKWFDSPAGKEYFRKLDEREKFIKNFLNTPEFEQAWFNLLIDLNKRVRLIDINIPFDKDCITTPQMLRDMVETILENNPTTSESEQGDDGLFAFGEEHAIYKGLDFYYVEGQGTIYGVTKAHQKTT